MHDSLSRVQFRVDESFSSELKKKIELLLENYQGARVIPFSETTDTSSDFLSVDIISESSIDRLSKGSDLKICFIDQNQSLFSYGSNIELSLVDLVLDGQTGVDEFKSMLAPLISKIDQRWIEKAQALGFKNLKKLENKAKALVQKKGEREFPLTLDEFLAYTQKLVDLEKELIHTDSIPKIDKIIKQFVKQNISKCKVCLIGPDQVGQLDLSHQFLVLPTYKGQFVGLDINWEDEDPLNLLKKFFFVHTITTYLNSQITVDDPFFEEEFWVEALDAIPFPTVLMTKEGSLCQHNSLFARINITPIDCMSFQSRQKVVVNEIPYNIFRKDIHHLDEMKMLFVFFTESFFLRGEGNLNPSGQELGIISSSIAHELNNPIAGIQAALSLLMLNENLSDEAKQILLEMKNGAQRSKQLIETFLGFSRANPMATQGQQFHEAIKVCVEQALNLLRFRTVESGIRFSLNYCRHADFRSEVNLSLVTMTFYLIFGELMTLYSHHLLIADKNQIEKVIRGEIIESSREIQIQLLELNISQLSLSKLIQNLLHIEKFVLQTSDYSLRFIYTSEIKDV